VTLCPQLRRLSAEHVRWRTELTRQAREDEAGRISRLLTLWDAEILPHCRTEEEVLLPELARRLSEADAVIVFTLGDHVVLRQLVRELRGGEEPARAAALARLERKLPEHFEFEERTLFPTLQDTLGCDGLARLAGEFADSRTTPRSRPVEAPATLNETPTKGRKP
jgi:iron-sulfur cluster repair protein YtfE (RIC family)